MSPVRQTKTPVKYISTRASSTLISRRCYRDRRALAKVTSLMRLENPFRQTWITNVHEIAHVILYSAPNFQNGCAGQFLGEHGRT